MYVGKQLLILTLIFQDRNCSKPGVRQYVLGSVMYLLVNFSLVAADPHEALAICSKFIKDHQRTNNAKVKYGLVHVLSVVTLTFSDCDNMLHK